MVRTRWLKAVLLALAASSVGCASINTYQHAHTLGTGKFQIAGAPAYVIAGGGGAPRLDVHALYGLSETIDLGARVGGAMVTGGLQTNGTTAASSQFLPALEILSKFQLTEPQDTSLIVSVAPSVAASFVTGATALSLSVPILIGLTFGEHQLVLGPKFVDTVAFSAGSTTNLVSIGTTAGFAIRVSDRLIVLPEIGLLYPVIGSVNSTGTALLQFGAGALFDI